MGSTKTYANRAADAFATRLSAILAEHGEPEVAPERLGERAALLMASDLVWTDHAGPFTDTEGVITLLDGVTKQAVSQRVRARRLLALRTGSGRLVYPLWQFADGSLVAGLADVLQAAGYDPDRPTTGWALASWMSTLDPELGGQPRDLLAADVVVPVVAAAREIGEEFGEGERAAIPEAV